MEVKSSVELIALRDHVLAQIPGATLIPTYLRVKPPGNSTVLHADFYHFRDTGTLCGVTPQTETSVCMECNLDDGEEVLLCDQCGGAVHPYCAKPRVHILTEGDWLCAKCHAQQLSVHTVWVPLHDVTEEHSVLLIAPGQFKAWTDAVTEDLNCPADIDLSRACSGGLKFGQAIMFNVKTVHGATVGTKPRASLDFRVRIN